MHTSMHTHTYLVPEPCTITQTHPCPLILAVSTHLPSPSLIHGRCCCRLSLSLHPTPAIALNHFKILSFSCYKVGFLSARSSKHKSHWLDECLPQSWQQPVSKHMLFQSILACLQFLEFSTLIPTSRSLHVLGFLPRTLRLSHLPKLPTSPFPNTNSYSFLLILQLSIQMAYPQVNFPH